MAGRGWLLKLVAIQLLLGAYIALAGLLAYWITGEVKPTFWGFIVAWLGCAIAICASLQVVSRRFARARTESPRGRRG